MKLLTFVILTLIIASTQVTATSDDELIREARSLFTSVSTQDTPDVASLISEGLKNIRPIISFVKSQIKGIMIDLVMEVWNFIKSILRQYKVKLFKRIGKFTVSDIFRCVFDGVVEFVKDGPVKAEIIADEVPEGVIENINDEEVENVNTISEPVDAEYEPSYLLSNPYLLARYS